MIKKINILKVIFFTLFLAVVTAGTAQASGTNCVQNYGGGYKPSEECRKITLDKKVQKPGSKDFFDNLSNTDPRYTPGQEVTFQIVVKNVGSDKLTEIEVKDTLPQFLSFVSGPGNYDKNSNILTFTIGSLESGQSQTFYIKAKVADLVSISENGFVCVTNFAKAVEKRGMSADDSSQVCLDQTNKVYSPVLGAKQTPPTGPIDAALPILAGMAGAGLFLKKKADLIIIKRGGAK